jgi:tetratricopeptide (TPR) repeat protein
MSMRGLALMLLTLPGLFGQADPLSKAEDLYRRTEYQASIDEIRASGQTNGKAYFLMGRDRYMLGDYKKAAEALERAFAMEPVNAEYALWLGRSFGRRAETAMPLMASKYAGKARAYFEKAVALDPVNDAALRDLFDYYLQAPGFKGGGFDKAEEIGRRIGERNPADGQLAQAELAERRKEFDTADEQLRRAVELAPREVSRVLDLAELTPNSPEVRSARSRQQAETLPEASGY